MFFSHPYRISSYVSLNRLEAAAQKVEARKASDALALTPQRGSVVSRHNRCAHRFHKITPPPV